MLICLLWSGAKHHYPYPYPYPYPWNERWYVRVPASKTLQGVIYSWSC